MSHDVQGGINYALTKRHYDCDDYVSLVSDSTVYLNGLPFTTTQDYYIVGLMAYASRPAVANVSRGWTSFTHGQSAAPAWLAPYLTALGLTWTATVPAFEAKDILFYATQNCWVRFDNSSNIRQFIPAETYMRFHRRCLMFFFQGVTESGILRAWMEG